MAIAQALDSPPIRRLALTRRSLKKDAPTHLEELMKLCDVSDQTFYRKVLSEVPDSPYRHYCIPCVGKSLSSSSRSLLVTELDFNLAVHLEELRAILHANERTIERDGRTLINVQRYTRFINRVQQLFHLPPPDLERFRHQGELAYLESDLTTAEREKFFKIAVSQLPKATREMYLGLATVYGLPQVKYQDVVKANTFQVVLEGVNHLAVWPETSRLNHECAPK